MAIYHLHIKVISRSAGKSAVAAAAYRHAAKMLDEKENKSWDYQKKPDVLHKEINIPENAPAWANKLIKDMDIDKASEQLWNFVEKSEKRQDAQLAREAMFALPIELNQEQGIHLAREFIQDQFVLRGMVADWSLHWDDGNPHVHVMLTMRSLENNGFGLKIREWNKKELLEEWREKWAEYTNFHLRLHKHDVRIDHRSYEDQGIDLIPSTHQGKAATDMDRRGINTDIIKEANQVRRENLARISNKPEVLLNKITSQSEMFTPQQLGHELGRYVNDRGNFSHTAPHNLSPSTLKSPEILANEIQSASRLTPEAIAHILKTIEHHESVFTERHIAKAVASHTDHAELFATALLQVKASPELLYTGIGNDGGERFTTRRMFNIENNLQKTADIMRKSMHVKISQTRIQNVLEKYQHQIDKNLTEEQVIAVKHILKPSSISCIVGRAGTGKSFSLGAARAVWEAQGLRVQGVALSGIAADGLSKDAAIPSRTIHSFAYAIEKGNLALNHHDVIVMDEAGMTDSVSMLAVLKAVQEARAKLVLVGDHAQIQPVGPGATFRALLERLGFAEIQTVYRQKDEWQREATVSFSAGRVSKGLERYAEKNCIHLTGSNDSALSHLVKDWFDIRVTQPKTLDQYLVVAHRNKDVLTLNQLLRTERVQRNEIAEGYTVTGKFGEMKISQGDRLVFLKNDRQLGVNNGRFATIQSVQFIESGKATGFSVILDGTHKEVFINPREYSDFAHGYAATVHKVQGMTVDHTLVYGSGYFWNRHLTYVAMSRHRETCHLYVPDQNMASLSARLGRLGMKDSLLDFPLAFAERRGIDITSVLKNLPKHLVERLTAFKDKLIQKIEHFSHSKQAPTLESVLLDYVDMELKQTDLISDMRAARLNDPKAGAALSVQVLAHENAMKIWVQKIVEYPEIKDAIGKLKNIKPQTLAQRGGFISLKNRLEKNQLEPEDYHTLLGQLKNKGRNQTVTKTQERDRGGRSK
jgi:ATP-dependent exoDNAse (exonuclease V) alpha subunit